MKKRKSNNKLLDNIKTRKINSFVREKKNNGAFN